MRQKMVPIKILKQAVSFGKSACFVGLLFLLATMHRAGCAP